MPEETGHSQIGWRRYLLYGLLGGAVANIGSYIGAALLDLPYPPEAVFQLLIAPVPGSIQSVIVETFREYAKYSTFAFAAIAYTFIYGIIAILVGQISSRGYLTSRNLFLTSIAVPTVIGLGLQTLLAARFSILSSIFGWVAAFLVMLVVNFLFATILADGVRKGTVLLDKPRRVSDTIPQGVIPASRRGFLKKIAIVAAVLAVGSIAVRLGIAFLSGQPVVRSNTPIPINQRILPELGDAAAIFRDSRISDLVASEVTDNRVFYRVDINPIPPVLSFDQWSMNVTGEVDAPLKIDKNSLLAMQANDQFATLECISNTINPPGALISNAKWTGVPLADVLAKAGAKEGAKSVVFTCADGYTVGIPIDRAMASASMLAYKMNDELLPTEHGSPLRAIVPGIYGMMNAKWITGIEVTNNVYLGYWQQRGWSNDARIKTTSIIYYPPPNSEVTGTFPIAGVAFAGDRGISKVEVSTDGGNNWNEATMKQPKSQNTWVLWAYEWTPKSKGPYTILVRATDGTGQLQESTPAASFPNGASGYHSIEVTSN